MDGNGMNAAQYLQVLADAHGFTRTVETTLGETKTSRPARGDGPLALVLFVHAITHPWLRSDAVFYGHVSVTHVPTGLCVDGFKHPFTSKPPISTWLILATAKGIAFAEDLRQRYLALDVDWADFPDDTRLWSTIARKVRAAEPPAETLAKVERDALTCFRAELKARTWTLNKTQTAELTRDLVRSRFPWTKRATARSSERREVKL